MAFAAELGPGRCSLSAVDGSTVTIDITTEKCAELSQALRRHGYDAQQARPLYALTHLREDHEVILLAAIHLGGLKVEPKEQGEWVRKNRGRMGLFGLAMGEAVISFFDLLSSADVAERGGTVIADGECRLKQEGGPEFKFNLPGFDEERLIQRDLRNAGYGEYAVLGKSLRGSFDEGVLAQLLVCGTRTAEAAAVTPKNVFAFMDKNRIHLVWWWRVIGECREKHYREEAEKRPGEANGAG